MSERYDRANMAGYYPNVSAIGDRLKCVSTYDLIYYKNSEIIIKSLYNNCYKTRKCDDVDYELLRRIALSSGVTKNQLYNYMLLQGKNLPYEEFKSRLYNLEYRGILGTAVVHMVKDNKDVVVYDLDHFSNEVLPMLGIAGVSSILDYHYNKDIMRFIRVKIASNQILLNLLCHQKVIRDFEFNNCGSNTYVVKNLKKNPSENEQFPLIVRSMKKTYFFMFVADTQIGREEFERKINTIKNRLWLNRKNAVLVIVAEDMRHMQYLTHSAKIFLGNDIKFEVMYTYDCCWFNNAPGRFYTMARGIGQAGLIPVRLV